ncbi:hypothetical protein [Haematobacter genomosp. 1]|uniref:Uncharacterized protein n=1 Tax=Haematobacter genomosp. 1 TaxID=366618 RepID=A0A212A9J4_9RHOB|nr:hypothetical protein [Haematobacter genomosp. 1]OWJ76791.1 hypothetical protein CDV49_13030 [Haematobacter genomosp. 1]
MAIPDNSPPPRKGPLPGTPHPGSGTGSNRWYMIIGAVVVIVAVYFLTMGRTPVETVPSTPTPTQTAPSVAPGQAPDVNPAPAAPAN